MQIITARPNARATRRWGCGLCDMPTTVPMHPRKMSMPVPTSSAKAICRTWAREWGPNSESSTPISRFNPANNAMVPMSWRHLQNTSACTHQTKERKWRLHEPLIPNSWRMLIKAVRLYIQLLLTAQEATYINTNASKESPLLAQTGYVYSPAV